MLFNTFFFCRRRGPVRRKCLVPTKTTIMWFWAPSNICPARSFSKDGFSPGSSGRKQGRCSARAVYGLVSAELERAVGTPRNSTPSGGGGRSWEAALMPCCQKLGWGAARTSEHHLNQHPGGRGLQNPETWSPHISRCPQPVLLDLSLPQFPHL